MNQHSRRVVLVSSAILIPIAIGALVAFVAIDKVALTTPARISAPSTSVPREAVEHANPLLGDWVQVLEYPCDGGMYDERRILSLKFDSNGWFSVALGRCDNRMIRGKYAYDPLTGRISLKLTGTTCDELGDEFDGEGSATIYLAKLRPDGIVEGHRLFLDGITMGTGPHGKACKMMFVR